MRPSAAFVGDDMACREAIARRDGRRSELDIALEVAGVTHLFGCYLPTAARDSGSALQRFCFSKYSGRDRRGSEGRGRGCRVDAIKERRGWRRRRSSTMRVRLRGRPARRRRRRGAATPR